jgi:hypothetical protein
MKQGFAASGITLRVGAKGDIAGGAEMSPARAVRSTEDVEKFLRDRIAVLYAGAIAQCSKRKVVDCDALEVSLKTNAAGDHVKIIELLALLRNLIYPDTESVEAQNIELTRLDTELRTFASETIDAVENALDELEAAIFSRWNSGGQSVIVTHAEVLALSSVQCLFPVTS